MSRRKYSRLWFKGGYWALLVGVQVPAVVLGGLHAGYPTGLALALVSTLWTWTYSRGRQSPWDDRPRSVSEMYLGLWPFFVWWSACLIFCFLAPIAWLLGHLTQLGTETTLGLAAVSSAVLGFRAVRREPRVLRQEVWVPGLPPAFDGYRVAHLSDLHCGPYAPEARVRKWVERTNQMRPDLVAVTGDLITSGSSYVAPVTRALGALRAPDGVFACMGNHDYFTDGEQLVRQLESRGIQVLRNRGLEVTRGQARLFVAGVDDTWTGRDDVSAALRRRPPQTPALLLAHDPTLFPQAAEAGAALTLSGHTHGGQFAVPGLARKLNLATLVTPFSSGLYRRGQAVLFVNRGAGTTGPPIRLGAPPEIALLILRSSPKRAPRGRAPSRADGPA